MLAQFVVQNHMKSHPNLSDEERQELSVRFKSARPQTLEPLPAPLLRKYIAYARANVHPRLTAVDEEKLVRVYTELRREAAATGSVAITVRHMESLIRCAEAHARLHLRNFVLAADIDAAIRVILDSFIQTQKFSVVRSMRRVCIPHLTRYSPIVHHSKRKNTR